MGNEVDHDETARLVLMQLVENENVSFMSFTKKMREHYTRAFPLATCKELYEKYIGFDGRVPPTHNLQTGEPLR